MTSLLTFPLKLLALSAFTYFIAGGWLIVPPSVLMGWVVGT